MTRKKLYMLIESVLCALTAGLPAAAAIRMYVHGAAVRASGDLFYYIFTREKAGAALTAMVPLAAALAAFTAAGWILGIRDEKAVKPAASGGKDMKQRAENAAAEKAGRRRSIMRIVILILAVSLIILGIRNGGPDDVFAKGAAVCTECIGLG